MRGIIHSRARTPASPRVPQSRLLISLKWSPWPPGQ
jgi:hypothetical protein